jgi:hypothetical protein
VSARHLGHFVLRGFHGGRQVLADLLRAVLGRRLALAVVEDGQVHLALELVGDQLDQVEGAAHGGVVQRIVLHGVAVLHVGAALHQAFDHAVEPFLAR